MTLVFCLGPTSSYVASVLQTQDTLVIQATGGSPWFGFARDGRHCVHLAGRCRSSPVPLPAMATGCRSLAARLTLHRTWTDMKYLPRQSMRGAKVASSSTLWSSATLRLARCPPGSQYTVSDFTRYGRKKCGFGRNSSPTKVNEQR